jgi:hypothetical protein
MDTDDDRLLHNLGRVIRAGDPIPEEVTLAARSAIIWRRLEADLAELLEDSATEAAVAGTRGGATGWRALTFESPTGIAIEVEVLSDGAARTMLGQLIPAASGRVALRHGRTQTISTADEMGRFRFDGVPSGPVSLRVEHVDGPVETGWVTI